MHTHTQSDGCWRTEITAIFPTAEQKFWQYFEVYLYSFFAVFQSSYVFILLFLSEPQTVFCGTLFDKHRFKPHAIHEDHVRMNNLKEAD
jgi:hypothetical protein